MNFSSNQFADTANGQLAQTRKLLTELNDSVSRCREFNMKAMESVVRLHEFNVRATELVERAKMNLRMLPLSR